MSHVAYATFCCTLVVLNLIVPSTSSALLLWDRGEGASVRDLAVLDCLMQLCLADDTLTCVEMPNDPSPLYITNWLCDRLTNVSASYVVLLIHDHAADVMSALVNAFTYTRVPVLTVETRLSIFSNKAWYPTLFRLLPPWFDTADVFVALLDHWKFGIRYNSSTLMPIRPVFVGFDDADGLLFNSKLENALRRYKGLEATILLPLVGSLALYHVLLSRILQYNSRVILFHGREARCHTVFLDDSSNAAAINRVFEAVDTHALNLTARGFVWIVSEVPVMSPSAPLGIIGVRVQGYSSSLINTERSLANVLEMGDRVTISSGSSENTTRYQPGEVNLGCGDEKIATNGRSTLNFMQTLGESAGYGRRRFCKSASSLDSAELIEQQSLAFTPSGDRIGVVYEIVNVQFERKLVVVGTYDKDEATLRMNNEPIVWSGGSRQKPSGDHLKMQLTVVSVEEAPFIYKAAAPESQNCSELPNDTWVPCFQDIVYKESIASEHCCRGLAIDLLVHLAAGQHFTYQLYLTDVYGTKTTKVRDNGRPSVEWTGAIGELVNQRADMALGALTVTIERQAVVSFTTPFMYQGITIMEKNKPHLSPVESFMQPFHWTLWLFIFGAVSTVSVLLYLLDKVSPISRITRCTIPTSQRFFEDPDEPLSLSGSVWFAWGVLLDSGIGEKTPTSCSGRVLGMIWCGFVMIVMASYTANLAALLVLDKPDKAVSGIKDPRLRNPSANYTLTTVKESSVYSYFQSHIELSSMFRKMEPHNVATPEQGIAAVRNGTVDAFVWDSVRLEYEAARDCTLRTTSIFGRSSYAVAVQKDSPWLEHMSMKILKTIESGDIEAIERKWLRPQDLSGCTVHDDPRSGTKIGPAQLRLSNMEDAFLMVGGGIGAGLMFVAIEVLVITLRQRWQARRKLSSNVAHAWRAKVKKSGTMSASGSSDVAHFGGLLPRSRSARSTELSVPWKLNEVASLVPAADAVLDSTPTPSVGAFNAHDQEFMSVL